MATQQAAASVGQGLLMARYETAFARYGIRVGQILITAEDTIRAAQYRNARRTLERLLDLGVVPIVNENDALASNEIRFGDNDRLSALWPTSCAPTRSSCSPTWTRCTPRRPAVRTRDASGTCPT